MYLYEAKCQEQPPGEPSPRHQPLLNVPLQICGFVLVFSICIFITITYLYEGAFSHVPTFAFR